MAQIFPNRSVSTHRLNSRVSLATIPFWSIYIIPHVLIASGATPPPFRELENPTLARPGIEPRVACLLVHGHSGQPPPVHLSLCRGRARQINDCTWYKVGSWTSNMNPAARIQLEPGENSSAARNGGRFINQVLTGTTSKLGFTKQWLEKPLPRCSQRRLTLDGTLWSNPVSLGGQALNRRRPWIGIGSRPAERPRLLINVRATRQLPVEHITHGFTTILHTHEETQFDVHETNDEPAWLLLL